MNILRRLKGTKIQYRCVFFSTIIFGLISQGMGIFNKFSVHDDLIYMVNPEAPLRMGRWLLYFIRKAQLKFYGDGFFSLPIFNGLITILTMAAAFCLLADILDLRSTSLCILLGGIAISFPCVTSMLGYIYTAPSYAFALFLSIFGVYLVLKKDKWFFAAAGIVSLVCSTAIYQAYIPVIVSLMLLGVIISFFKAQSREQQTAALKKTVFILFSCICFIGLYFLITFTYNHFNDIVLNRHKGIRQMGRLSPDIYLQRIFFTYKEFFIPSRLTAYEMFPCNVRILYHGVIIISILSFVKMLYDRRQDHAVFAALALLVLLIPLAVNFIFIMVDKEECYSLMVYGQSMIFVFFIWAFENIIGHLSSLTARYAKAACLSLLCMLVLMYCRFDNTCYLQAALIQSQATRYFSTLVTRIQSTEGYDSEKYISYIDRPQPGKQDNSIENVKELDHIKIYPYWGLQNALKGDWREYMRIWCGYTAHETDPSYFSDNPEVKTMPHYPDEGSIKIIDDTIVINF